MAKTKKKSATTARDVPQVPCHAVHISGGVEAARAAKGKIDPRSGCPTIGTRSRLGVPKIDLKPEYGAQSGIAATGKKLPACSQKRAGCPVQLVFEKGEPFLRFCKVAGNKQPGLLVPAGQPEEAYKKAAKICSDWKANGRSFENVLPENTPLGGAAVSSMRRRR